MPGRDTYYWLRHQEIARRIAEQKLRRDRIAAAAAESLERARAYADGAHEHAAAAHERMCRAPETVMSTDGHHVPEPTDRCWEKKGR
jgi:hypothetical protein